MGFIDKAKDAMKETIEKIKDPDQNLVEKAWPVSEGNPDVDDRPEPGEEDDPTVGIDPDLDPSEGDQYDDHR